VKRTGHGGVLTRIRDTLPPRSVVPRLLESAQRWDELVNGTRGPLRCARCFLKSSARLSHLHRILIYILFD